MDKLTLQDRKDFPLTTNSLAFMQAAYAAMEKLGYIGGDNYIVSGCEVTGTSAAPGYMFLKGILMPFKGGSISSNVQIVKKVTVSNVDAGTREQTSYNAEFGVSADAENNISWDSIIRTDTIISLMSQMTALNNRLADVEDDILVNAQDIQSNADNIEELEQKAIVSLAKGTYGPFDIRGGNPDINSEVIPFGATISTANYLVLGAIRLANDTEDGNDDLISWAVRSRSTTNMEIYFQEEFSEDQSIFFDWMLIPLD
ncbi:hypothetical protein [Saccharicrinis fermentans]|uniref:Uncharacterized protein n=1 Tax=Saccharicrinis fermentans DSM 9555 = JCM 21142 TaxID=869213 RepID=W7Y4L3_9BACT|nr:hypothetical protein [Saccharicrinis fermentans]GAF05845.1 hypothetical protein JCM21142_114599 [Saccharicrinis fermentans DSM 9555 = JCM 21142]